MSQSAPYDAATEGRPAPGTWREVDQIVRQIEEVLDRMDRRHEEIVRLREHGRVQMAELDAAIRSLREGR